MMKRIRKTKGTSGLSPDPDPMIRHRIENDSLAS